MKKKYFTQSHSKKFLGKTVIWALLYRVEMIFFSYYRESIMTVLFVAHFKIFVIEHQFLLKVTFGILDQKGGFCYPFFSYFFYHMSVS